MENERLFFLDQEFKVFLQPFLICYFFEHMHVMSDNNNNNYYYSIIRRS